MVVPLGTMSKAWINRIPFGINTQDSVQKTAVENNLREWFMVQSAVELTRRVILETDAQTEQDRYYALESILQAICNEHKLPGQGVDWIQSYQFYGGEMKKRPKGKKRGYDHVVRAREDLKEALGRGASVVVTLYSTTYSAGAGHYIAVIYYVKERAVYIWDSMAREHREFLTVVRLVFEHNLTDDLYLDEGIVKGSVKVLRPDLACSQVPQETGGFALNVPGWISEALEQKLITREEWQAIKTFGTEAQNHFCYFFALFMIHATLLGKDPCAVMASLAAQDPLIYIKKYIWAVVHCKVLQDIRLPKRFKDAEKKLGHPRFWSQHFLCVWTVAQRHELRQKKPLETELSWVYECLDGKRGRNLKSMEACFQFATK